MASSSNTSRSDDQQQHHADKEAAKKKQNDKESSSWSNSKQMKYIAFVVLVIIVVMSAAMGTIWGVVKPKRPVYAIEYAHIAEAGPNPKYTSLTGNFSFVMRAYNPNKKSTIYYESMEIYNTVDSRNETAIPVKPVENFYQPPFNVTRIRFFVLATFSSEDGADIINEYLLHGRITVNISVKAVMKFRYGSWISMPHDIGIYCQPAAILLERNFQTTGCYVDL